MLKFNMSNGNVFLLEYSFAPENVE